MAKRCWRRRVFGVIGAGTGRFTLGHAVVRAAGGEVWQAPRNGHDPVPDWLAGDPVDAIGRAGEPGPTDLQPLRYNKESLVNPRFVARGW